MGDQLVCPQSAIYKVWFESNKVSEHAWPAVGNQLAANAKRANGGCTVGEGGSGSLSATGTGGVGNTAGSANTASTTSTGGSSGFTTSVTSASNTGAGSGSTGSSGTITTGPTLTTASASKASAFTLFCYPYADPGSGSSGPLCECDGLDGSYPALSSTSGQTSFNQCGYTASPTTAGASTVPGFTTTKSNGEVVSCATSTYYNYAVNTIPTCAGSTKVVATVTSLASAYSASSASSASVASYSSAAAVPSAGCWILSDDGWGDSTFEVYGINGWAGPGGENLWEQEDGCGIVSGPEWFTDGQDEFQGKLRDTQYAYFGLSFFKGGCVERAVHSAGGPPPGTGSGQLACEHLPSLSSDQTVALKKIAGPQLSAVQSAASGTSSSTSPSATGSTSNNVKALAVDSDSGSLAASASAALPALSSAAAKASAS